MISTDPGHWLAAFVTLGIYSFLYKENPLQKIGEYMIVGLGLAHSILMAYQNVTQMAWNPLVGEGLWYMAIPIILGFVMWTRFFPQISYISRTAMGLIVGVGAGVALRGAIGADLFGQLLATIRLPLDVAANWIIVVGVFATIAQFMYIATAPGTLAGKRNILSEGLHFLGTYLGQATIMVALGAAFAYTIMGRVSTVIGRFQFLFRDWIHLIKY